MIKALVLATLCAAGPSFKVRVDGDGYLRFVRDGRAVYAKETALQIVDGKLADSAGDCVLPSIQMGAATSIDVDLEGNVFAVFNGSKVKAGQLVLAQFPETEAFQKVDVVLTADDKPHLGTPGDEMFGVIRQVAGFDIPAMKVTIKPEAAAPAAPAAPAKSYVIPDSVATKITESTQPKPTAVKSATMTRGTAEITVQQHSVVEGDHILLGQVAQIDGDPALVAQLQKVDLGDTPPTGVKRVIDRTRIMIRMRFAGLKPEIFSIDVPAGADIRRKGQTIPNSDFVVTAIKEIMSNNSSISGTWQCSDSFADLEVPSGKLELRTEEMTGVDSGNASVIVAIYIDGTRFNSRTVHLKLKDNVPPVQVGAAIKVVIIAGRAQVEVPGVARSGGRMGQSIQVEVQTGNPPVKTFHTGIVTGPGTVEVRL
ncbi:MAG TPA: hypothetical protein VGL56_05205 [Fimbriimonadaceae bacterium]|jgi:hypothetical protein